MDIARTYELGEYLLAQKPSGRTTFERSWEGTQIPMTGGVFLYFDGRVYEKYGKLNPELSEIYVLVKQDKALATEIKMYVKNGYPDDYDSMCFGCSVDTVKAHMEQDRRRPRNVRKLLEYISEILRVGSEDPRLPPSVAAMLVRQEVIRIDDDGTVVYLM